MRRFLRAVWNGLRLRCPGCRLEPLFTGPFRMHAACPRCGCPIEREDGYFVGAIYINYGATVGFCLGGYFFLEWLVSPGLRAQLIIWPALGVVFPLCFFRHSRGLWLNVDHFFSSAADGSGRTA